MSQTEMKPLVTVVSGANRGVGLAIVQAIAASSTPAILYAGSRAGKDLALRAGSPSTAIRYVQLDIADLHSVENLVAQVKKEEGRVDVLINNAGINVDHDEISGLEKAVQTIQVNYQGTVRVIRAFLPVMNDGGRIVSVSSTASHLQSFGSDLQKRFRAAADIEEIDALTNEFIAATKNERANKDGWASPYCVSKACINAMTAVFAKENPKLFVNCCCPGWCDSDMGRILGQPGKSNEDGAKIPLRLAFKDIGNTSGRFWENDSISSTAEGKIREW